MFLLLNLVKQTIDSEPDLWTKKELRCIRWRYMQGCSNTDIL